MDCATVQEKLVDYASGDLSRVCRDRVENHLAHCYYCQEELDDIEAVLALCRQVLRHPRPHNGFRALSARMAAPERGAVVLSVIDRLSVRRLGYWAVATATAAMITLSVATPAIRDTRQFLGPLESGSQSFSAWAESEEAVAPLMSRPFIERRVRIEEKLRG